MDELSHETTNRIKKLWFGIRSLQEDMKVTKVQLREHIARRKESAKAYANMAQAVNIEQSIQSSEDEDSQ